MKLYDSELKVLEILWSSGPLTAAQISEELKSKIGWNRNTTYTVIKKCIQKGAIRREDPKFLCIPLITQKDAQSYETEELVNRMFSGSKKQLFAALLSDEKLTDRDLREIRALLDGRERK